MLGCVGGSQVCVVPRETSQSQMSRAVKFHPRDILKTTKSQQWEADVWRPGAEGSGRGEGVEEGRGGGGVVVGAGRVGVSGALE